MTLDHAETAAMAEVLDHALQNAEIVDGTAEALVQAGGLVLGSVLALAALAPLDEVAAFLRSSAEQAAAQPDKPSKPVEQIPRPNSDGVLDVAYRVGRSLRQVRAASGQEVALARTLAGLQAGSDCIRRIAGAGTLAVLLDDYQRRAAVTAEMVEAGEAFPAETRH